MSKYQEHQKQGKPGLILEVPSDGIIYALNFADTDFFPNIPK